MKFRIQQSPLRFQFFIWTTVMMIAFCCVCTFLNYSQMRKAIMEDALKQSEIILQEVEAIREYVKTVIRPKAYELTEDDVFIIELMSTTYVSLQIMDVFQQQMEDYAYRRASLNPKNEQNRADKHEEKMADWFDNDRNKTFWQGMVEKENGTFFVSMMPDYISQECLYCHGTPKDAPTELLGKYGDQKGFRFKEGDLAGINSVSIPITDSLYRLYSITAIMFLMFLGASICLLVILNLLFDKLVVSKLVKVINTVEKKNGESPEQKHELQPQSDELDTLRDSVHHLTRYVRTARKGSGQMPNFIGPYVIEKPLIAGTMSWLYSGFHSQTREAVTLKIPFDNISENPIYRTFYRNEIKVLRNCDHRAVFKASATIENVLISAPLNTHLPFSEPLTATINCRKLFSHLFELVAYLHTHGIVHHDLRPGVFLLSKNSTPLLVDAGLAWWYKASDDLRFAELGPQGNSLYMAPEQLSGIRGDSRSDIYSLGIWLHSFFTGILPFQDELLTKTELLKRKKELPESVVLYTKIESDIAKVLQQAVHPDPEKRYQWVEDLRDDILSYIPTTNK